MFDVMGHRVGPLSISSPLIIFIMANHQKDAEEAARKARQAADEAKRRAQQAEDAARKSRNNR